MKVTNLNADLLDGVDWTALPRRVTGTLCERHRHQPRITTAGSVLLLHPWDRADSGGHPVRARVPSTAFSPAGLSVSTGLPCR